MFRFLYRCPRLVIAVFVFANGLLLRFMSGLARRK